MGDPVECLVILVIGPDSATRVTPRVPFGSARGLWGAVDALDSGGGQHAAPCPVDCFFCEPERAGGGARLLEQSQMVLRREVLGSCDAPGEKPGPIVVDAAQVGDDESWCLVHAGGYGGHSR